MTADQVLFLMLVAMAGVVTTVGTFALGALVVTLTVRLLSVYRPFWRGPTTIAYLVVVWAVERLLTRLGDDLHTHPAPFVLFGLTLGLGLTLLEGERRCEGAKKAKKQGEAA